LVPRRHQKETKTTKMSFILLTALVSLAVGTHAAALLPRQGITNPRLAQFRVFSATGCYDLNDGFYTVDTNQSNQCYDLYNDSSKFTPNGYVSIELQALTDAAANCECKSCTTG
jgi:hypothetical protein